MLNLKDQAIKLQIQQKLRVNQKTKTIGALEDER